MTLNLPGFTADASLYKTGTHYRTSNRGINLRTQQMGSVHLAVMDVPGEVIIIEDDIGDDTPWFPPSGGGHTAPGTSGGGSSEPGGGGGGGESSGGKPPPKRPPKGRKYTPKQDRPCWVERSETSGDVTVIDIFMDGKYFLSTDGQWLCDSDAKNAYCNKTYKDYPKKGETTVLRCYNGQSPDVP
jgi:hypothetical protein